MYCRKDRICINVKGKVVILGNIYGNVENIFYILKYFYSELVV